MRGIQTPRVRPHVFPNTRVTVGHWGPMISSPSHPVTGGTQPGASDATHWTPHGVFVAQTNPWQARTTPAGVSRVTRSPGAYFQTPALFQLVGIPDRALVMPQRPAGGRTGTPPVRHMAINPFPAFKPPLPSYPAPAAWPGQF